MILCCSDALGYRYSTAIGSSFVRELMGLSGLVHATIACFSGGVGCDVVTSAPSPVRSGPCGTDVADITSGHRGQDGRYFASTQSHSSVSLPGPETSQAGGGGGGSSRTMGSVRPHRSEATTVQALMDLALPRFEGLGDGPRQVHRPWKISAESPALPASRRRYE